MSYYTKNWLILLVVWLVLPRSALSSEKFPLVSRKKSDTVRREMAGRRSLGAIPGGIRPASPQASVFERAANPGIIDPISSSAPESGDTGGICPKRIRLVARSQGGCEYLCQRQAERNDDLCSFRLGQASLLLLQLAKQ